VTLRGADLALVWRDLAVLSGFVVFLVCWAVLSFRKRVA